MNQLAGRLFLVWVASRMVWVIYIYIRANLYDVQHIRRQKQMRSQPHARRYRQRPLVSVVVIAQNAEKTIEQCLRSIVKSSYRKHEIVIIGNTSTDKTKAIIEKFIVDHPKKAIRFAAEHIAKQQLEEVIKGSPKLLAGEFAVVLGADCTIDRLALRNIVQHFQTRDKTDVLTLNSHTELRSLNSAGLLQKFENLASSYTRKAVRSKTPLAVAMRRQFMDNPVSSPTQYYYAADVLVQSQIHPSYEEMYKRAYSGAIRSRIAILAIFADVVAASYLVYLVFASHNTLLFTLSWSLLTGVLLIAVWTNTNTLRLQKLKLTAFIPIGYVFLVVHTVLKAVALLARLLTYRRHKTGSITLYKKSKEAVGT